MKASEVVSLAASASRLGGSSMSLRHERAKSVDKTEEPKKLPIINPLVQLPMWPSKKKNFPNYYFFDSLITIGLFLQLFNFADVSGGTGFISQALLANADALCAAVSPLMDPDETLM